MGKYVDEVTFLDHK